MAFMRIEFPSGVKSVRSRVAPLSESLGRLFSNPHFVAKDMLDLQRSEGGIGKVFFSFLIPLAMIWAMLFIFSGSFSLSPDSLFLVFCVLVGALSSTMYNWLTEFDGFSSYSFLPVRVSDVIKGKLRGYALLNLFSAAAVAAFALWNGNAAALPLGLAAFVSVSVYTLSFTVYLGGLRPNVLIYSARTFLAYVGAAAPAMIVSIVASIGYPPALAAIALVMLPASFFVTRRSFSRWDSPAMSDRDF
jgi:hypothetical protein